MAYLMIIDDDEDFAYATATVLKDSGYEVQIKMNIQSAEKSMKMKQPDLVILDVMFPENGTAGFELARKIRHHDEKLKDIPILMLSAINTKFPLGFSSYDIDDNWLPIDDFIEKPVDFDELKEKITKLLSRKKE